MGGGGETDDRDDLLAAIPESPTRNEKPRAGAGGEHRVRVNPTPNRMDEAYTDNL